MEPFVFEDVELHGTPGQRTRATFTYSVADWRHQCTLQWWGVELDERLPGVRECLLNIGLCVLLWPFMAKPRRKVLVRAGGLSEAQRAWWQEFYRDSLVEFAVCNCLEAALEPEVAATVSGFGSPPVQKGIDARRGLCGLGGGKDSLVAMKLLREQDADVKWFYSAADSHDEVHRSGPLQDIVRISGIELLAVSHDPDYVSLEAATEPGLRFGCVGGPVVPLIALDAVLIALLGGFSFLAVGNERSANFGNGFEFMGREVNHQWDKGAAFERALNDYIATHLLQNFHYFSPLASLWEVQIAGFFALRCTEYFSTFCSCNSYQGNEWAGMWCGDCSKCLFVFVLLSAWCAPPDVRAVFGGKDLLGPYGPAHQLQKLLGTSSKPLDCVGTPAEVSASLRCASVRLGEPLPWCLERTRSQWRCGDMEALVGDFGEPGAPVPPWFDHEALHMRISELLLHRIAAEAAAASLAEEDEWEGVRPWEFGSDEP